MWLILPLLEGKFTYCKKRAKACTSFEMGTLPKTNQMKSIYKVGSAKGQKYWKNYLINFIRKLKNNNQQPIYTLRWLDIDKSHDILPTSKTVQFKKVHLKMIIYVEDCC